MLASPPKAKDLNAVPASLAQCDGRLLLSAAVDQDVIVANILNVVFNTQVSGLICVVHDVGWLYVRRRHSC
jgi:hypothetical protein